MSPARTHGRRMRPAAAGAAVVALTVGVLGASPDPAGARGLTADSDAQCTSGVVNYVNQTPGALLQLGADTANGYATGAGVVVAVVDSGVSVGNAHLQSAVIPGADFTNQSPDGRTDVFGHGTAVAGEIAARPVSGSGVVGLAPGATILPVRIYTRDPAQGEGDVAITASGMATGIRFAADRGAKVVNVSLSTTTDQPDLAAAVAYAQAKGALIVASGGNRTTSQDQTNDPRYPGAYPGVLAVAAVDGDGVVTDDSIHGSYIGVAAPGTDVLTTFLDDGDCQLATEAASTSYATAYVSAAAALLAQKYPQEGPAQWRYRLEATALRVRPDSRDDRSGWGVISPVDALTFVADGSARGPAAPSAPPTEAGSVAATAIPVAAAVDHDHRSRDQAVWILVAAVVVAGVLALAGLLRRVRPRRPART